MGRDKCDLDELSGEILEFIAGCGQPALLEPGEEPISLRSDSYAVESRNGRLMLEAWGERNNVVRRIAGIGKRRPGRLELVIERLGGRSGQALLLDQQRPTNQSVALQGSRQHFREQFRRFLRRQFPGWKLARLSTEPDLEHTLSPVYPRALLQKGARAIAAVGAPAGGVAGNGALTFGLIWLDYVRRRASRCPVEGLALYLPAGEHGGTCLRIRYLDQRLARYLLFVYTPDGAAERIDANDHGNLDTHLVQRRPDHQHNLPDPDEQIRQIPGIQSIEVAGGQRSYRLRGLEIGRWTGARLLVGIDQKRPVLGEAVGDLRRLAAELARLRSPTARDRTNAMFTRCPENWLESQVRDSLEQIDAGLLPLPIYGQVPAFAGGNRGVLDLLAVEAGGRLVVIELKASSDPHLPLQALDYWMRVRHHSDLGEFGRYGYFPGVSLSKAAPRLLIVAPALEFHPTTEVIIQYFDSVVPIERIGLGADWRRDLRVVLRLAGASKPGL